jgi:catechol 1,2-dioxygenase
VSHSSPSPLSPLRVPTRRLVENSRRDFLAWLAAGTAISAVGCADDESENGRTLAAGVEDEEGESAQPEASEEPVGALEDEQTVCRATTRDARGPYWEPGAPVRTATLVDPNEPGVRLLLEGRMFGPDCKTPLKGYALDIWQADKNGEYYTSTTNAFRLRGKIKTDATGRYRVETILPGRYGDSAGIRPAHLHVSFLSPGGNVILTTQLYFQGDPYLGQADYCTRSGTCNSSDPRRALSLRNAMVGTTLGKRATFNPMLPRT